MADHSQEKVAERKNKNTTVGKRFRQLLSSSISSHVHRICGWTIKNGKPISVAGGIFGFAITTLLMWHSFTQTLEVTKEVAQVNLARDLSREYFANDTFKKIHLAIVECKPLHDGIGGQFSWQQLNDWLGFLDDVGIYFRRGALDYEMADHLFGGIILEAYVYAEVREFIAEIAKNGAEPDALKDFLELGRKIAENPRRAAQVKLWQRDCRSGTSGSTTRSAS